MFYTQLYENKYVNTISLPFLKQIGQEIWNIFYFRFSNRMSTGKIQVRRGAIAACSRHTGIFTYLHLDEQTEDVICKFRLAPKKNSRSIISALIFVRFSARQYIFNHQRYVSPLSCYSVPLSSAWWVAKNGRKFVFDAPPLFLCQYLNIFLM